MMMPTRAADLPIRKSERLAGKKSSGFKGNRNPAYDDGSSLSSDASSERREQYERDLRRLMTWDARTRGAVYITKEALEEHLAEMAAEGE